MREGRLDSAGAPGTGQAPAPVHPDALLIDQAQLVSRHVPLALLGLVVNVLVLGYVLWDVAPRAHLLVWVSAFAVLIALRTAAHLWLRRNLDSAAGARRWLRWSMAGTAAAGVLWGSSALLFPTERMMYPVFIAFLTGGLSAGSLAAYAPVAWLAPAFFVPATGLVSLGLVLRGGELALIMGAMVAFFALTLVLMTRGVHAIVLTGLRLRIENEGLVAYLSEAKVAAERLNEELKQQIADREQAQQALQESEGRFRSLVENATDGIGFTFEGRIHYANQAALDLIGYTAEEVLGMPIERFLADTTLTGDELVQRYQDRIAGKEVPRQYETQMVRKDGTVVDVIFSNALVSLDGKLGVMSIVKDITERKRAEQELREAKEQAEEATRVKDQFVSLLAHDLRAPLNSIFSLIALMGNDPAHPLSEEQQRILRAVSEQGETTLRMIEDLLSVSRLHTGKLAPELRFADAAGIVATAVSRIRPIAAEKRIVLLDEVPHQTRLYTDPDMFGKVLYNLLSNAVKFCRRGDRIRLYVPPGRPTTVAVEDTGPGVQPTLAADLFRHDVKTTTPGHSGERGTGLGLPLSQDLMHALGGEITLEATSPQGSVFFATLPAVRPKVLVVGRDESLALFVRPHLDAIDAECLDAPGGEEALRRMDADGVHLVVAETDLRGNGGTTLLERLRGHPRGRSVPIIVIADKAEAGQMEHGFRLGADEIVVKPLVPNDFLVRLRRFIT